MGKEKEKKAKRESSVSKDAPDVVSTEYLAPIAKPLADDKLSKKVGGFLSFVALMMSGCLYLRECDAERTSGDVFVLNPVLTNERMPWACMQVFKLVKKAAKRKQVKRGVKEVIKAIRKKTKGYVVLCWVSRCWYRRGRSWGWVLPCNGRCDRLVHAWSTWIWPPGRVACHLLMAFVCHGRSHDDDACVCVCVAGCVL